MSKGFIERERFLYTNRKLSNAYEPTVKT